MKVIDLKFLFNNVVENIYSFAVYNMKDDGTMTLEEHLRVSFYWSEETYSIRCFISEDKGKAWEFYNAYHAPSIEPGEAQMSHGELLDSSKYRFISSWIGIPIENVVYLLNFSEAVLYPERKKNENIIH